MDRSQRSPSAGFGSVLVVGRRARPGGGRDVPSDGWACRTNALRDAGRELLEVGGEHLGQRSGSPVVGGIVAPGRSRLEEFGGDLRAGRRHGKTEDWVLDGLDLGKS